MESPYVIIIGGPNGAGKSTLAKQLLPLFEEIEVFVNADAIATSIAAESDRQRDLIAGRRTLALLDALVERRACFALESTLAGMALAGRLRSWRALGYRIILHYIFVDNADVLRHRIAHRVIQGGHDIPIIDQQRRLERSIRNVFELYQWLSDDCTIHDGREGTAGGFA